MLHTCFGLGILNFQPTESKYEACRWWRRSKYPGSMRTLSSAVDESMKKLSRVGKPYRNNGSHNTVDAFSTLTDFAIHLQVLGLRFLTALPT